MKLLIRISLILIIVLLNISCDQISKNLVRENISNYDNISVIADNFILTKVENTGAFLSFGNNFTPIFKIIFLQFLPVTALLFLLGMVIYKSKLPHLVTTGFCFVIGGGIGNIFDRIVHGSVTDFMYIEFGFLRTGIFNMADLSVVVGTLLVFATMIINNRKHKIIETIL